MSRIHLHQGDLVVVDAKLHDYDGFLHEIGPFELRIRLFPTGEAAMRAADARTPTLWMVNFRLPDMSGISLLKLVRRRQRRSSIIIAGDVYSARDELAARSAGATAYVCKPPSSAWLQACRPASRSHAIRAGPLLSTMRETRNARPDPHKLVLFPPGQEQGQVATGDPPAELKL